MPEHQPQPLAHVGQADAGAVAARVQALAVVGDGDRHAVVVVAGEDPDRAAAGLRFKAMLDRVLHQRLQHHRRQRRGVQCFGHVDLHLQTRAHADAQDLEIRARAL
jgi:hypothetical protein